MVSSKKHNLVSEKKLLMELIKILKDNELSDIKFKTDEISIYISKNSNSNFVETKTQMVSEEILTKEISNNTDDTKLNLSGPGVVKSPMVGTIYEAPEPGANPFVNEGDEVTKGQTLFIVEAMKVMNPITAPIGGKIKKIFVKNSQPVEFDEVLTLIE